MASAAPPGPEPTQVPGLASDSPAAPSAARSILKQARWMIPTLLLVVSLAAFAGYRVGERERAQARQGEVQQIIQEQFSLGLQDLEQEQFETARQRFEYIIRLDPAFPAAAERLADALLGLSEPLFPTPDAIAATPTPNLAPVAEILDQAPRAHDHGGAAGG